MVRYSNKLLFSLLLLTGLFSLTSGINPGDKRVSNLTPAEPDTTIYVVADQVPVFPGQIERWLEEHVRYPQDAWDNGIAGRVIVGFVVERDGSISQVEVLKGVSPSLDAESARVIAEMPQWQPAKINGETIRFRMFYPLNFEIVKEEKQAPLSYENYNRLLDDEEKITLDQVEEERDQQLLKVRTTHLKELYENDKNAFRTLQNEYEKSSKDASASASALKRNCHLKTRLTDLESVYSYINALRLKVVNNIGEKDFIRRYAAATPVIVHLDILQEAKLREIMDKEDHARYFKGVVADRFLQPADCQGEPCSYQCLYYMSMPRFAAGSIPQWLARNVKYPMIAQENGLQGKVFVGFIVREDGSVTDVEIHKGDIPSLNIEAMRVVRLLPKFIPGKCNVHKRGLPLRYTVPVNFQLQ